MIDVRNFKLTIEYDGTAYSGWQRQKERPTIQEEIEKAISVMIGTRVVATASGRTDAGVHALGQVANFRCETRLGPEDFERGLNSLLPQDIAIRSCEEAGRTFHARYDARSKRYHYHLLNRAVRTAVCRQYAWFIRRRLDIDAMRQALAHLTGTHDFKAFEGTGSPRAHTVRTVYHAELVQTDEERLFFAIEADGFLRFMVRNIVGTLAEIGLSKLSPEDLDRILKSRNRSYAGATAPPHGLFLVKVNY